MLSGLVSSSLGILGYVDGPVDGVQRSEFSTPRGDQELIAH